MLVYYKSMDNSAIHRIRNSNSSFSASPQHPITPCSYTLSSFLELTNHNSSVNFTPPQAVSTYLNIYTKITLVLTVHELEVDAEHVLVFLFSVVLEPHQQGHVQLPSHVVPEEEVLGYAFEEEWGVSRDLVEELLFHRLDPSRFAVEARVHELAQDGELEFVHLVTAVAVTMDDFRENGLLFGGRRNGLEASA